MRVLVTGGTGYLGSAIVRALAARGHDPVIFARRASASTLPGRAVDGDIRDRAAVMRAAEGADAICHTAALVSTWRPRPAEFDEINVGGLHVILDAARTLGTPRIVYTSSFLAVPRADGVVPAHAHDYQRTKMRAREVARAAADGGAPIMTIVPGVIYGPGPATEGNLVGRLVADHLAGRLPGVPGADRRWSYAYVDDVAHAHVLALEGGRVGEEYRAGGDNVPQMRIFEIVRDITGARLPRRLPYSVAWAAGLADEARARLTGRPPRITRGIVEILRYDWVLETDSALEALGYRTRSLDGGVRAVIASLGGHGRASRA
jgi:nucleoside-diphosphate-sugar epimerase